MLLILSQLHKKEAFSSFFLYLFLNSPSTSFDPLECIKHSQIKRTSQEIYKQPHATFYASILTNTLVTVKHILPDICSVFMFQALSLYIYPFTAHFG